MIKTKRLTIRKEELEDAEGLQCLLREPEGRKFTGGVKNFTIDEMKEKIEANQSQFSFNFSDLQLGKKRCALSVIVNENGKYAGYCGFQYCDKMNEVEIMYGFLKDYWGKGFGTEAAQGIIDFGFTQSNMDEVFAAVNPINIASERILINIGMKFRQKIQWPKQGLVSQYSINRNEYENLKKKECEENAG